MGKNGHFWKNEHKKVGHFEKKHVINFKTRKKPKMNMFDFGAFQKQMYMPSREKYLLHILSEAFQVPSRTIQTSGRTALSETFYSISLL